jgi:putative addiction module antidote
MGRRAAHVDGCAGEARIQASGRLSRRPGKGIITVVTTEMPSMSAPKRTDDSRHVVLKVTQVGNSLGVVLPREVASGLNVVKGDSLFLTESPEGYRLTKTDPEFARKMELAREIMRKRHNVLRELAK